MGSTGWGARATAGVLSEWAARLLQVLPVTNRSTQRFPDAGVLASYLQDFGDLQADRISYETAVERIDQLTGGKFRLAVRQVRRPA